MVRIFVYGTLKQGFGAHALMQEAGARLIGPAKTAARYHLYDQGGFPGMIEDADLEGGVKGELYEVDEDALWRIDAYECINQGLFRRAEVELEGGGKALAYLFNREYFSCLRIESGEWT